MNKLARGTFLLLTVLLSGCVAPKGSMIEPAAGPSALVPVGEVVAAVFGPNGRLWRLTPTKSFIYLDYSDDQGATFSTPVAVNPTAQKIRARGEDRPSLAVDSAGRIYLLWFADGKQPWSTWFSRSDDGGQHFSAPQPVSDQAGSAKQYQDILALDSHDELFVFWHDERRGEDAKLYYAQHDPANRAVFANQLIEGEVCDCCRTAVDFDQDGQPVLFKRMIYPGGVRDHGLLKRNSQGEWHAKRATFDEWQINACPEHGPALAISPQGRYHIAWFTQGKARQGLFYAHSDDQGAHFSAALPFGERTALASHPALMTVGQRVVMVWRTFDGKESAVQMIRSSDRGERWTTPQTIARSTAAPDHPMLIRDGGSIYLSWYSQDRGYQLISIPQ